MVKVKLDASTKRRPQAVLVSVANLRVVPDIATLVKPPETAPTVFRQSRRRNVSNADEVVPSVANDAPPLPGLSSVVEPVKSFAVCSTQTEPEEKEPRIIIGEGTSTATSTQTVHPGAMTVRFATTIKKMPIANMCMCVGKGRGQFIECKSESLCEGNRFYHISCVNISETDLMVYAIQKKFVCVLCTSTQNSGTGPGYSAGVRYITECATVSLSGILVTSSPRTRQVRDPYKPYFSSGSSKPAAYAGLTQSAISQRSVPTFKASSRHAPSSRTWPRGQSVTGEHGATFVSSAEASGHHDSSVETRDTDSAPTSTSRTILNPSPLDKAEETRDNEFSSQGDTPHLDSPRDVSIAVSSTMSEPQLNVHPVTSDMNGPPYHSNTSGHNTSSSWHIPEEPSSFFVLPPCPKIAMNYFADTSQGNMGSSINLFSATESAVFNKSPSPKKLRVE
jgi:hypothetical protein